MKKLISVLFSWVLVTVLFVQSANAQITVSGSTGVDGIYTSLTNGSGAFLAINGTAQTGNNIVITITGNSISEAGTNSLNAGTWTSLNIYPTGTGYTISGNIAGPLISLNGADNVTIDGRVNQIGAKDLTISNTNSSGYTIFFINDATYDTIEYCDIKGVNTSISAGTIYFSTTTGTTGNDNNIIDNCSIHDGATTPCVCVYSSGTSGKDNSSNTISNCNIYNFYKNYANGPTGIDLEGGNTDWSIQGNSFYQTSTRIVTGATSFYPIYINNSTSGNNFSITGNYLGGTTANCGGTAWTISGAYSNRFCGIYINVSNSSATNIQGNIIANLNINSKPGSASTGVFTGIQVSQGSVNIGTTSGNTIGSGSVTGAITINYSNPASTTYTSLIIGINLINTNASDIVNVGSATTGNTIGGISLTGTSTALVTLNGIRYPSSISPAVIRNNKIGDGISQSIQNVSTVQANFIGIRGGSATTTCTISDNIIRNFYNTSTSSGGYLEGIYTPGNSNTIQNNTISDFTNASTAIGTDINSCLFGIDMESTTLGQTISNNSIYNFSNTAGSAAVSIIGIYYKGPTSGTNTVSNNFIYNLSLSSSSVSAQINGIRINSGTTTYSNNIINLGGSLSTGYIIYGIYESGAASNNNSLYFNTVYLGGTPSGSTSSTYALYNAANTNTRNFRNNILNNARSGGTTGQHYTIYLAGNTGLTIDYNDYVSKDGAFLGRIASTDYTSLDATWRTASGGDVNSVNTDPHFYNAGGTSATNYISATGVLNGVSGTGITIDFGGVVTRDVPPFMGAWELNKWKGTTNTDFNTATNWTGGVVIPSEANLFFNASPSNHCNLGADLTISNITNAQSTYNLVVNGYKLTINGNLNLTNSAKIDAQTTNSTLIFNGSSTQTIPSGAFVSDQV
jgi:hypothetical protein